MQRTNPLVIIALILLLGILVSAGCIQGSAPQPAPNTATTTATIPGLLTSVPDVRQSTSYSCGAASLQAVFNYWGIDAREGTLMQELNTSYETGTLPESIVRVAQAHGLQAECRRTSPLPISNNSMPMGLL